MFRLDELQIKVVQWAYDRNIIDGMTAKDQLPKLMEEAGELAGALVKNRRDVVLDSIGDLAVVLIIMAEQESVSLTQCLNLAWDEIKDRRGKVQNGVFVKEEDL